MVAKITSGPRASPGAENTPSTRGGELVGYGYLFEVPFQQRPAPGGQVCRGKFTLRLELREQIFRPLNGARYQLGERKRQRGCSTRNGAPPPCPGTRR